MLPCSVDCVVIISLVSCHRHQRGSCYPPRGRTLIACSRRLMPLAATLHSIVTHDSFTDCICRLTIAQKHKKHESKKWPSPNRGVGWVLLWPLSLWDGDTRDTTIARVSRWLQLPFGYHLTSLRPFDDLRYDRRPTCVCVCGAGVGGAVAQRPM